jgi:hypothetical protein
LQDSQAKLFRCRNITALEHGNGFTKLPVSNRKRLLHPGAGPAADLAFLSEEHYVHVMPKKG